jgi:hypothetical protein
MEAAAVVAIPGDGDASERRPLLSPAGEIHPYPESPSHEHPSPAAAQSDRQRVASLDVFRGLTVAVSGKP